MAEMQKCFRWLLVQMKTLKLAFEINWPLEKTEKTFWLRVIVEETSHDSVLQVIQFESSNSV